MMISILIAHLVVLLATGCSVNHAKDAETQGSNSLAAASEMATARAVHTAVRLKNGKVLIAGGFTQGQANLDSAEIFDAATKKFSPTGKMTVARSGHTATLLNDGRVLIAGGFNGSYLDSAEIYDDETGTFTAISKMTLARNGHIAVLLTDGTVLLAGGTGTGWSFLSEAEIFDPKTNTFSKSGSMTAARESHTATRLADGRVLITGGHRDRRQAMTIYASAEIFDPETARFSAVGDMAIRRHKHDAVLINDGRVLVIGGSDERDGNGKYRAVEAFDPKTGKFAAVGDMLMPRFKHIGTSVLLPNGKVLIAGGAARAEIYDAETNKFELIEGTLPGYSSFSTASLLKDGRVLIVGGYDDRITVGTDSFVYTAVR